MTRSRTALLTALGVDNFGSGLFLPVVLPAAALRPAVSGAGTLDRVA